MRKILLGCLIVALAAGLAFFLARRNPGGRMGAAPAELVPAGTLAYVEIPDVARTLGRWPHTALHDLWSEPEVQNFVEQPMAKVPQLVAWSRYLRLLEAVQPRRGFIAVTALEGNTPHTVAGFAFSGRPAAVEALLAEGRASLRQQFPAGKSDLVPHGTAEIRTFATESMTVAETTHGGWYFTADSAAGLAAVLDRLDGKVTGGNLAGDADFQSTMKPLSAFPEVLAFARFGLLQERLTTLLTASGISGLEGGLGGAKEQCFGFSSRIEGSVFRDTLFARAPGPAPAGKHPMSGLAFTTPQSFLFVEGFLPEVAVLAAGLQPLGADTAAWSPLLSRLGPDFALVLDWPNNAAFTALAAIPVKEGEGDLRTLMSQPGWGQTEQDDVPIFIGQGLGLLAAATPCMALSIGKAIAPPQVIMGLSPEAIAAAAARDGGDTLAALPAFMAARRQVPEPTGLFAFLNTGALVDRLYGTARPVLAMGLALNPDTAAWLDAGKLPSASTLASHLGTTIYSTTDTPEGRLSVSVGAVTFYQLMALLVGSAPAAFPALEKSAILVRDDVPGSILHPGGLPPRLGPAATPAPGPH